MSKTLSLITASHTDPQQRTRAMTWWGVAAAGAGAAGVVLGGLLTASLSWRWVLLVNVPIGVALTVAAVRTTLQPSGRTERDTRIDVPGAVTVTLGAAAVVYGVSEAAVAGWTSARVLGALGAGVVLLVAFVGVERRSIGPLIPAEVFTDRNVRVGNVLTALLGVVITAPLFFLSLYLQQALGQTALRAGLSLLPLATVISVGVIASQRLIPVVGARRLVVGGGIVAATGLAWLADLPATSAYVTHFLLPTIVVGAGMSVMLMPAIVAATDGIEARNAGVASGMINMSRQIGAAVGLAALVTVAESIGGDAVAGFRVALAVIAGIALVTAATALLLGRGSAPSPIG